MSSADLEFLGQVAHPLPPGARALVLTIQSDFPTIANAGVRVFRDDGSGNISQVGQGVVIDTSINTPQGDTVFVPIPDSGRFAVAFQGQAVSVDGSGVTVRFLLRNDAGVVLEDFDGARSSPKMSCTINGAGFAAWAEPLAMAASGQSPGVEA